MTANKGFKRRVRARSARTGESYQAAHHRLVARTSATEAVPDPPDPQPEPQLRIALNVLPVGPGRPTAEPLAAQADVIIGAIARAAAGGARVALFSEGAVTSPHKRSMSRSSPEIDEADWSKVEWPALRRQLTRIAAAARQHSIWVVVGAIHDLGPDKRPHNCLYVISDAGELVTRYDKRRLSTTEITHMYMPGTEPVVFAVDGFTIGLVIGLEVLFPDYFTHYADEGADLIVAASHGGGIFEQLVTSYALVNQIPIALVIPPDASDPSRSGVYGPTGAVAVAASTDDPAVLFADVGRRDVEHLFHYKARHGFYDDRLPRDEPRSVVRNAF